MTELNVLYATNHAYINYLLVSIYSLLENNPNIFIRIHIIYDEFLKKDFKRIETIVKHFHADVFYYDFKKIKPKIEEYKIPKWKNTEIANARLFFTEYITNVEKILYLDSETIIVNSLNTLKNYQMPIHMVKDSMPKKHWKNLTGNLKNYYNSGVIWIDIEKWKEEKYDALLQELFLKEVPLTFPDQDAINIALQNKISPLPLEFNLFSLDYLLNPYFLQMYYEQNHIKRFTTPEVKVAKKHPIIIHTTPVFQYQTIDTFHPLYSLYTYYYQKIYNQNINIGLDKEKFLLVKAYLYAKLLTPAPIVDVVKKLKMRK